MASDPGETGSKVPAPADIFACRRCNACCMGYGGTYVTEKDVIAIAEFVGESPERFIKEFCRFSGNRPVLAQREDGNCLFLKPEGCGIHPVKPRMCRAWPFIESVVRAPENWKMMAGSCPGMRTDVSDEDIVACVSRVLSEGTKTP